MKALLHRRPENAVPTRYSLLSKLRNWDDQESWKVFFDTYWRMIYSAAMHAGLTDAEAQDVVQETVICIAKDIHKFKRDRAFGSFKGWLRNTVHWRIVDQFRKRPAAKRQLEAPAEDGTSADLLEIPEAAPPALESLWQEEWEASLIAAAVGRVKQQVKEEHYQIFHLYVVKGWPAAKVARATGASAGKIYVLKHRITALIKKEIRNLEKHPL